MAPDSLFVTLPGGAYEMLAGRDLSRALAQMKMDVRDSYDDLHDLSPAEREGLARWESQFQGEKTISRKTCLGCTYCHFLVEAAGLALPSESCNSCRRDRCFG